MLLALLEYAFRLPYVQLRVLRVRRELDHLPRYGIGTHMNEKVVGSVLAVDVFHDISEYAGDFLKGGV